MNGTNIKNVKVNVQKMVTFGIQKYTESLS